MSTTLATPYDQRIDVPNATDAELLDEYSSNKALKKMRGVAAARGIDVTNTHDSYQHEIELQIWMRCYAPAFAAAMNHPAIFSVDDAENAAIAAMAQIVDGANITDIAESCENGARLADIAAHRATNQRALDEVHKGATLKERGTNQHTAAPKAAPLADRRIYATDPSEYGFDAARTVSADGLSYDMTAVEDAIDQERFGALTENEAAVEWFIETVTHGTGISRDEALAWLHTTGLTNEVEEYIDLVANAGSYKEAARLAEQRRFPVKDVAAIIGTSSRTAERRIRSARSATYSDCTLTGTLRSGSVGTRRAEVNTKTLAFALTTSLEAHAAQAGQTLSLALLAAVPDSFFADYIAEYMADGTVAADIDPVLIAEMRAAAEAVAA